MKKGHPVFAGGHTQVLELCLKGYGVRTKSSAGKLDKKRETGAWEASPGLGQGPGPDGGTKIAMDAGLNLKRWKEEEGLKINTRFCNWACHPCAWPEKSLCCLTEDRIQCRREGISVFPEGDVWSGDRQFH